MTQPPAAWIPSRWTAAALAATCLGATAVFLALSFYAQPDADDWQWARAGETMPLWDWVTTRYMEAGGRVLSYALIHCVFAAAPLLSAYWLVPLALQAILLGTLYVAVAMTIGRELPRCSRALAALLIHTVYLAGMSHPREAFYWITGALTFVPGTLLMIWAALLLLAWTRAPEGMRQSFFLAAGLIVTVLAAAYAELFIIPVFTALGLFMLRERAETGRMRAAFLLAAALAAAAALAVVAAPGNFARGQVGGVADIPLGVRDILPGIMHIVRLFLKWLTDVRLWAATVLLLPLLWRTAEGAGARWLSRGWAPYAPALFLLTLAPGFVVVFFGYREIASPYRVRVALYALFLAYWFCAWAWWCGCMRVRGWRFGGMPMFVRTAAAGVFIAMTTLQGNVPRATADLFLRARPFKAICEKGYDVLREAAAAGRDTAVIPQRLNAPWTLRGARFTGPDAMANRGIGHYFGVPFVDIDAPAEPSLTDQDGL